MDSTNILQTFDIPMTLAHARRRMFVFTNGIESNGDRMIRKGDVTPVILEGHLPHGGASATGALFTGI
jgi:hypothetical protein